jgi:pimeloyl-ACP methyl ester carboxylesterase/DNA-binding CsgD family transcriptional regulator
MEQQIRFCHTADGVRIAYATVGNGPPLVKVANWLSHIEYDWHSPVWRHWYESLMQQYTLIRYDQRGCGLSDWDVKDFTFESWVQDLETVVAAVGLKKFALLGISQGGPVALAYSIRNPQKASRIILYGSYARGRLKRTPSRRQLEETQMLIKLIKLGWGRKNPAFRQVFTTLYIPDGTLEQIQWFNDLQRISTSPENAVKIVKCLDTIDVSAHARQVNAPTLILHAKGDARIPFEEGRLIASLIPGAQFIPLESRNHILMASEPAWEKFLAAVHNFMDVRNAGPSDDAGANYLSGLTKREGEVLEYVAQGLNNSQIAERLYISPKTVRNHITNIFSKLEIQSRPQAIVRAREAGLGNKNIRLSRQLK